MKAKALKIINTYDSGLSGPAEEVVLGIEVDGHPIGLGTYYFGPGMSDTTKERYDAAEKLIRVAVKALSEDNA